MNSAQSRRPCQARHANSRGFTLVEVLFIISVMAILAAVALPFYRDYVERSRLSDVMVQFDAMREKAQVVAAESSQDLCNWPVTWGGKGVSKTMDPRTAAIDEIVKSGFRAMDPKDWTWRPSLDHLSTTIDPGAPPAPLTVQFSGMGNAGVARARLLAGEFQKNGLFNKWVRETAALTEFTVFLGACKPGAAQSHTVAAAVTAAPHLIQRPSCSPTQQVGPDGATCVAKVCGAGLVMDATSGACNPGCKAGEFEPTFRQDRGAALQAFSQPGSGPHTCFSVATQSCPADKAIPTLRDGALVCEAFDKQSAGAGTGPKPTACDSIPNSNPLLNIDLAKKLPYKAHDCGGQPGDLCEIMAGAAGSLTCQAGSFPSLRLVNDASGSRTFERGCLPAAECQSEWWRQSSQIEACTRFAPGTVYTQNFSCTYCCVGDNCNGFDLNPDGNSTNAGACPVNPAQLLRGN